MKYSVWREWAVIVLLLCFGIAAAARWDWFGRVDQAAYDLAMQVWQRPAIPEVVIVGIDEASLEQLGRWPWNRAIHATVVDRIASAKPAVIGLDLILTEPDRLNPRADAVLGDSIARAGNVVLPVIPRVQEGVFDGELAPVAEIGRGALSLSQIHAQPDTDGIVRRTFLLGGAGEPRYRLLGQEALLQSRLFASVPGQPAESSPLTLATTGAWNRSRPVLIPFSGAAGHFRQVSYVNVLRGDVSPSEFAGKIVLVGVTASGLGDEFPTPVTGVKRAMPGVEIHANVLQAIAQGIELREVDAVGSALIAMFTVLIVMSSFLWLTPGRSLLVVLCTMVGLAVATLILFRFGMLWIAPSLALVALASTYPIWSWRKLAATQRYFDAELARLAGEPDLLPATTPHHTATPSNSGLSSSAKLSDFIEKRIVAITNATERLRNLKRFVADTLESLPTAALVTDFKGEILLANSMAATLLAKEGATLQGTRLEIALAQLRLEEGAWAELLPSLMQNEQAESDAVDQTRSVQSTHTLEAKTIDATPERDCAVQFAPLYTNDGRASGMIVTIADVTALKESERRRDEVLRFLSHDMRSPQASIITLLEMVKEDPEHIPNDKLLERVGKYARRTLTLADDFLRMARAERVKASDFVPIELTDILQDVVEEGEDAARGKSIRVVLDAQDDEAWVSGDRDLLTRAVINLLSNAIKYSPDNTTTTVSLRADDTGSRWRIDVSDEGFGIAPENMSRLFQRFQRLEQEGQPKSDGIGLGLVFVKTVVERMAGEVQVSSRVMINDGDSHGTTFSILLPSIELGREDG
jgi:CHASE2 domain-containing sensor protein/signal transduction histidine kinase